MKFSINVREKGVLLIQVTSSKKSNSYEIFNDRITKRCPFNTGDCLINNTE